MTAKNKEIQTPKQENKERSRKMTAKKEELEKVTGEIIDSFNDEDRKCYKKFCKDIDSHLTKIKTSFLAIASTLYNIYKRKLYEIEDYNNIYDMAKDKFQISRGLCHEYISICDRFGIIEEKKCTGLQPEYKEYEHSKLAVMAKLPDSLLKNITPRDVRQGYQKDTAGRQEQIFSGRWAYRK